MDDRALLPKVDAILVLGTSPYGYHGQDLYTLSYRLNVAAGLWSGDYADRILVSGIKIGDDYDEASLMRDELVARGVTASAIELDHKGNRTWDSVYRARHVYGKRRHLRGRPLCQHDRRSGEPDRLLRPHARNGAVIASATPSWA